MSNYWCTFVNFFFNISILTPTLINKFSTILNVYKVNSIITNYQILKHHIYKEEENFVNKALKYCCNIIFNFLKIYLGKIF